MRVIFGAFAGTLLLGCAHRPEESLRLNEGTFISEVLLGTTNSPPGTLFSTKIYIVRAGDTLTRIGNRFGLTVRELRRLNPHMKTSRIFIGQRLRVAEEQID